MGITKLYTFNPWVLQITHFYTHGYYKLYIFNPWALQNMMGAHVYPHAHIYHSVLRVRHGPASMRSGTVNFLALPLRQCSVNQLSIRSFFVTKAVDGELQLFGIFSFFTRVSRHNF